MSLHHKSWARVLLLSGLGIAAIGLAFSGSRPGHAGQPAPAPAVAPDVAGKSETGERPSDRAAVRKAIDGFAAAFKKGDAKAVAGCWTREGEYIGDDGTTFTGRAALEKAYTEFFSKNPENDLQVEIESVRFPSRDTAVVEGHFKVHKGKKKELTVSRCSLLCAREDEKWRIAILRERPGDGLSLRDLEWLIGTWESKQDGTVVRTRYDWTSNKAFIRCEFSIVHEGKTNAGTQMIGKDPTLGTLHVWTFEDSGGIGDTDITRDGKKWIFAATGATGDGRVITATNILTPIDANSFLWHSVERTLDDQELPDLTPIKVIRVKDRP
jgi:uncharacterized protein (TIGR02246 family)